MGYEQFTAIIVDSDTTTRMRLKQVCSSVATFGKVNFTTTLSEGIEKMVASGGTDVMFVSHLFGQEDIGQFIRKGKELKEGQDTAYVLVLPAKDQGNSAAIAQNMLSGADGMLFEPYSVDQLVDITRLAAKVRKERSLSREQATIRFLLKDIISNLDALAYARSCGAELGPAIKHFHQMCKVLQTLQPESQALYFSMVADVFEAAPVPQMILGMKKYVGASKRIKKKVADHISTSMNEAGAEKPK